MNNYFFCLIEKVQVSMQKELSSRIHWYRKLFFVSLCSGCCVNPAKLDKKSLKIYMNTYTQYLTLVTLCSYDFDIDL